MSQKLQYSDESNSLVLHVCPNDLSENLIYLQDNASVEYRLAKCIPPFSSHSLPVLSQPNSQVFSAWSGVPLLPSLRMAFSAAPLGKGSLKPGPHCHVLHKPEPKLHCVLKLHSVILISVVFNLGSSECSPLCYFCLWVEIESTAK